MQSKTRHLGGNILECCGFLCCLLNQQQYEVRIQKAFSLNLINGEDEHHVLHCVTLFRNSEVWGFY